MKSVAPRKRRVAKPNAAREIERQWCRLLMVLRAVGRRRAAAVACFGLLGMSGAMGIGLVRGIRTPAIHDEFSYLLAADTFAAGRVTNPTHPHWQHFETFHVIHQPTYASKYPPAQGLVLALGQVTVDAPIAGVWFSVGVMSAAIAWMLLSWLPPAWAILAATFCMVHVGWLSYWGQSYWGGAVAATGGALAFGALRHLSGHPNWFYGSLLGVGLSIMAASRPVEGSIAAVCLILSLAYFARRQPTVSIRALVPTALITMATLGALAYYNWRVTGSALTMPYQVHQAQYAAAPPLLFMKPKAAPTYRHKEMERYWTEWSTERHLRQQAPRTILASVPAKIIMNGFALLGPGLVAAAVGFAGALRRPGFSTILLPLVLINVVSSMTKGSFAHYVAPTLGMLYLVFAVGLWSLHRWARRIQAPDLALLIVAACVAYVAYEMIPGPQTDASRFSLQRASTLHQLEMLPQKSLVFVRYGASHHYHHEWVYNRADIDGAKVVWARSMGEARDRELAQYFADRTVWTLAVEDGSAPTPIQMRTTKQ